MSKSDVHVRGAINLPYKGIDAAFIQSRSDDILSYMKKDGESISVIICDDREIQDVNRQYRNKDYPTDVISFAYNEVPFPGETLDSGHIGDIFISLERAYEQSCEYDVSFEKEITRILVHAILHLYGYDHETGEENAQRMFEMEDKVLDRVLNGET